MSEEQLKAFLEAVKADAGLQEKLKAASDADATVTIANEAGFVFSADDIKSLSAIEELSDEELEFVSGGGGNTIYYITVCQDCGNQTGAPKCVNPNSGYWWCQK